MLRLTHQQLYFCRLKGTCLVINLGKSLVACNICKLLWACLGQYDSCSNDVYRIARSIPFLQQRCLLNGLVDTTFAAAMFNDIIHGGIVVSEHPFKPSSTKASKKDCCTLDIIEAKV